MNIKGKNIGILVDNQYEELEFWYPYLRLQEEQIKPTIIAYEKKSYASKLGYEVTADICAKEAYQQSWDAIIIPGGYAPDKMRIHPEIVQIVKENHQKGALIAAICHAGWLLASARIIEGKKVTGFKSIKADLENAGGHYVDEAVVVDDNIITSRTPEDLPYFCQSILKALSVY